MKKILAAMFAGVMLSTMGAVQYGLNIEKENDYVTAGLNTAIGWTVTAKQDISLIMSSDLDYLGSVNKHMANVVADLKSGAFTPSNTGLGYMVYDMASKTITSVVSLDFSSGQTSLNLKEGETIGFWMTVDGVNYSSIRGVEGYTYNISAFGGGDGYGENYVNKVFNFANGWYREGNTAFGYEQSLVFGIGDYQSAPAGQPLPGVLAALLLGGSAVGAIRKARKK